jgi:hypothetical protein
MIKYKLLRDTPMAQAGTKVEVMRRWIYLYDPDGSTLCLAFINREDIPLWIEEIPEKPKTVHDLKKWDIVYKICAVWIHESSWLYTPWDEFLRSIWLIFLTEQEAKNAIIRMETASRKDKYIPEEWDGYYSQLSRINWIKEFYYIKDFDYCIDKFMLWLAFRTKEECKTYMTPEVRQAFGY